MHKEKRVGIARIPPAGLARLVASFAGDPHYAEPLQVLFLTGVRPSELVRGVNVQLTADSRLQFVVLGTKITDLTGQPVRVITVSIDNEVADALALRVATGNRVVHITDPRELSDTVRYMSTRLFPRIGYVISPYTFRHALAVREKAGGRSRRSLATILGHVSGESQRSYGAPQQRAHLPGSIHAASATRPVRNAELSCWNDVAAVVTATESTPHLHP